MSSAKVLFGFHAVGVRLKTAPQSIIEIHFDASRRDARMRAGSELSPVCSTFWDRDKAALSQSDELFLINLRFYIFRSNSKCEYSQLQLHKFEFK
jgi:hypothetical protein